MNEILPIESSTPASSSTDRKPSPAPVDLRWVAWLERLSGTQLTFVVGLLLFALAAWPLLLVALPPFQDLPNHVATAHIIAHPDRYPEFVFNGFFKSNSLLTLWFHLLGGYGLFGAARGFTALVLLMNALALPFFALHFTGRRGLLVASLFGWPLVHGFFVSMGMLNFAFAFGLSLVLLVFLDRQRQNPGWGRGLGIGVLSGILWYAHPFPLAMMAGLVALHALLQADWRARIRTGVTLLAPLAPAGALFLVAAKQHLVKAERAPSVDSAAYAYLNPWEILGHFWLDASGALTWWGSMTLVPAVLLPYFAWKQRKEARPFFSTPAMVLLSVGYVALPVMMSNWWHLNCRLVPFLWLGLLLRLPPRVPRIITAALVAGALSFSAIMGIDYLRLDRDRAEFTAGLASVPPGAALLPLMFRQSKTADFVASLSHAWGYYTVQRNTAAPMVFAAERSYPIGRRDQPPRALVTPALDRFAEEGGTPERVCKMLRHYSVDEGCTMAWRDRWLAFWREATPRFSHLLTWAMPAEARGLIPEAYRPIFAQGDLTIYARGLPPSVVSPAKTPPATPE